MTRLLNRYPIYVPSRGRYQNCMTAKFLLHDATPFQLVVEEEEAEEYRKRYGEEHVTVLPFSGRGLIASRNWIKEQATAAGHARHWQLDDNINWIVRRWRGRRVYCDSAVALRVVEDFCDRYENVAIGGLNYWMFGVDNSPQKPYRLNQHIYSASLILNELPFRWRSPLNDDTDYCLQVLTAGWCTVQVNAFLAGKVATMTHKGGNTGIYTGQDGRLRMARSLERLWPGIVSTQTRYGRPQHVVKDNWFWFDTPLRLRPGVDLSALPGEDDYGLQLREVTPLKSARLRRLIDGESSALTQAAMMGTDGEARASTDADTSPGPPGSLGRSDDDAGARSGPRSLPSSS